MTISIGSTWNALKRSYAQSRRPNFVVLNVHAPTLLAVARGPSPRAFDFLDSPRTRSTRLHFEEPYSLEQLTAHNWQRLMSQADGHSRHVIQAILEHDNGFVRAYHAENNTVLTRFLRDGVERTDIVIANCRSLTAKIKRAAFDLTAYDKEHGTGPETPAVKSVDAHPATARL